MALPKDGHKRELREGEIVMSPTGYRHERIVARILAAMLQHAEDHRLGAVCGSSLGCWMESGNLLCPDVSFITKTRLPVMEGSEEKYLHGSPDLVVEVLSPWDRTTRVREKLEDYFSSGARLAWIVDPGKRSIWVHRSPAVGCLLSPPNTLDGEDVLPGFRLPLAELFAELSFE